MDKFSKRVHLLIKRCIILGDLGYELLETDAGARKL